MDISQKFLSLFVFFSFWNHFKLEKLKYGHVVGAYYYYTFFCFVINLLRAGVKAAWLKFWNCHRLTLLCYSQKLLLSSFWSEISEVPAECARVNPSSIQHLDSLEFHCSPFKAWRKPVQFSSCLRLYRCIRIDCFHELLAPYHGLKSNEANVFVSGTSLCPLFERRWNVQHML